MFVVEGSNNLCNLQAIVLASCEAAPRRCDVRLADEAAVRCKAAPKD